MANTDVAKQIWNYLTSRGWSKEAVAALLGNMQSESGIIADRWESDIVGNMTGGYGLVQWTPATKYIDWAKANGLVYQDVISQCKRIEWEVANNQQFYHPNMTFKQFTQSTQSPEYLADIFIRYYERPANPNQPIRQTQARYWYNQFRNETIENNQSNGGIEMQVFIKIGQGKNKAIAWFDGQQRHTLPNPDCINILNRIYRANTGKDMPSIDLSDGAEAWLVRLDQAINAKS